MSKTLTHMGKAMRLERELEAQENERRLRTRDLKNAAEALDKRHASPHSRRVALTGLHEYWRVISTHSQPEPAATIDPTVPGLVLSDIVAQPVAWLWQHYLPLGALTLLEGEPGSGTSLLALHLAACVTGGHALPGGSPSTQGTVILVTGQDHPGYTIAPRLLAAGGDPARVLLLTTVEQVDSDKVKIEDRPFSLARDLYLLEEAVTRTHAALVILDSLDTCRPGEQRQSLLLVTKHALCEQPGILSFQLCAGEQGILALDWLGVYTHPTPPYQDGDLPPLSCRNRSLLHQRIVSALHASAAPMNARSLTTITGFNYELVRKTLRRMFDDGDLACPARGLYTTPGHPCLAQPAASTSTPPPEPPVPTVASVPNEPEQAVAQTTPPQTPVPTVASVPTASSAPPFPDSENDPANDSPKPPVSALEVDACSLSTASPVPIIPSVPPATPPGRGQPFLPRARNPLLRGNPECATLNSALAEERRQGDAMEYRPLGRTGWKISAIGFGAWAIGGSDWGSTDDTTSLAALHRAIDLGVNFIDTADVYGDGHSEQLIAQVRKARSEHLIIATKAGRRLNPHLAQGYTRQ